MRRYTVVLVGHFRSCQELNIYFNRRCFWFLAQRYVLPSRWSLPLLFLLLLLLFLIFLLLLLTPAHCSSPSPPSPSSLSFFLSHLSVFFSPFSFVRFLSPSSSLLPLSYFLLSPSSFVFIPSSLQLMLCQGLESVADFCNNPRRLKMSFAEFSKAMKADTLESPTVNLNFGKCLTTVRRCVLTPIRTAPAFSGGNLLGFSVGYFSQF